MNTIEITFNDKHCLTKELIEISMNTKDTKDANRYGTHFIRILSLTLTISLY